MSRQDPELYDAAEPLLVHDAFEMEMGQREMKRLPVAVSEEGEQPSRRGLVGELPRVKV